jgi:hypothetical protein
VQVANTFKTGIGIKEKAPTEMVKDLEMTLGVKTDESKLTKKINNMKMAVKRRLTWMPLETRK